MSQSNMIKNHLEKQGAITQMEALNKYGCARLAARIKELRQDGVDIKTETVKGQNKFGKPVSYAEYRL